MDRHGHVHAVNPAALRVLELDPSSTAKRRRRGVAVETGALRELVARGQRLEGVPLADRAGRATGIRVDVMPMGGDRSLLVFRVRTEALARELWTDDAVATVAHEFRNPLTAMLSALHILGSGDAGVLAPGQQRFVDAIVRGVGRLSRIVDGYLDLGRVRAGALALQRADENPRTLLETIAADLALCHPELAERLRVDVAEDVRGVFIDRDRVTQVLVNLLYNAARFTPGAGTITLRASRAGREALDDSLRLLPFEILGEPLFTCLEVEDEGIGMGADALARVFDRYDESTDSQQPGGGAHLGLHIARSLVDAHDGRLRIDSRLGVGTTASVYLPSDAATAQLLSRLRAAEEAAHVARAAHLNVALLLLEDAAIANDSLPAPWLPACDVNPEAASRGGGMPVWIMRDGLALALARDGDAALPVKTGACRIEENMTLAGALRAAARNLQEPKSNRAARAVPGLEPVRD